MQDFITCFSLASKISQSYNLKMTFKFGTNYDKHCIFSVMPEQTTVIHNFPWLAISYPSLHLNHTGMVVTPIERFESFLFTKWNQRMKKEYMKHQRDNASDPDILVLTCVLSNSFNEIFRERFLLPVEVLIISLSSAYFNLDKSRLVGADDWTSISDLWETSHKETLQLQQQQSGKWKQSWKKY